MGQRGPKPKKDEERNLDNFSNREEALTFVLRSLLVLMINRGFLEEVTGDVYLNFLAPKKRPQDSKRQ